MSEAASAAFLLQRGFDERERPAVREAAERDGFLPHPDARRRRLRRERDAGERLARLPLDHEPDIEMVSRKVREIALGDRRESRRDDLRVLRAHFERELRPDVAEDRLADAVGELGEVLVREMDAEPVLAGFAEQALESIGREVLELVHVEIVRRADVRAAPGAREYRGLEPGEEDEAEQVRVRLADAALGEVGEEDAAVVYQVREAEAVHALPHDGAHERVAQEGAEFGEEVIEHLALVEGGSVRHLLRPEIDDRRIREEAPTLPLEAGIYEKARDIQQAPAGARHDGERRVAEPVLELRADDAGALRIEELVEDADAFACEEAFLGVVARLEEIEPEGVQRISRVEEHDVLEPLPRYAREQPLDGIAVRIHEADAFAVADILQAEILEDARFADAGLAEEVQVAQAVRRGERDRGALPAEFVDADGDAVHRTISRGSSSKYAGSGAGGASRGMAAAER